MGLEHKLLRTTVRHSTTRPITTDLIELSKNNLHQDSCRHSKPLKAATKAFETQKMTQKEEKWFSFQRIVIYRLLYHSV